MLQSEVFFRKEPQDFHEWKSPFPFMAGSPLHLDFGVTSPALTTALSSICKLRCMRGQVLDIGKFESLHYPAVSGVELRPSEDQQEFFWQDFFGDPTQWWDDIWIKRTPQNFKLPPWQSNRQEPVLALQLGASDSGMKKPPEDLSASAEGQRAIERFGAYEDPPEIGMLLENGNISDSVDALTLRVLQGCHVHTHFFYLVLKRCIARKDLVMGRRIHALTIKSGYEGDSFLATHLISLYASHGRLEEAMQVFTNVSMPTVHNWTNIIFAYARHGQAAQAIRLYQQMVEATIIKPDNRLYVAILKACATAGDLVTGKEVHARIVEFGGKPDIFVQAGLINMYAKCGSLGDAHRVFDSFPERNVVTWTVLIAGYAQQGMSQEALSLYSRMQQECLTPPNSVTYICLLQACASVGEGALDQGRQLHAEIEERGLQEDLVLGGSLVNMYAKCGSLVDARRVFDRLPERDVVTWTSLIGGYTQQGMGQEAISLYSCMQYEGLNPPDSVAYVCLLQACASVGVEAVDQGKRLHAQIEERGLQMDLTLGGSLINMYAKCGSMPDAHKVFNCLPERNVTIWNALLAGYNQHGLGKEALSLYSRMQQEGRSAPDSVTYVGLLQACASEGVGALDQGRQLHAQIMERGLDVALGGGLINMYAKCGSLGDARRVFDTLPERDVVAWTTMIAGYTQQGLGQDALNLYSRMQQEGLTPPNSVTYVCLLQACANVGVAAVDLGKLLHAQIQEQGLQEDLVLSGSLVNMYAKCGSLGDAHKVFARLPERNVVTWNALLAGYAQQGMGEEALGLYSEMQKEHSAAPDSVTYVSLLQACALLGALPLGQQLQADIEERKFQADVAVGAALVNMYAKCGSMFDSQQVFDILPERSIEAWNALTGGYARQGDSEVVLDLFRRMTMEGVQPDGITFVCLLTACSHVGQVDKGRQLFEVMKLDYKISPSIEHYTCMVDLLGRAGHLEEALQMAKTMPCQPNSVVWLTLLGACRKWKNVGIGEQVFHLAVTEDAQNAALYLLMSSIYASAHMWEEAKAMQAQRKKCGARKEPGQSWWTDMGGVVHTFVVGDKKYPESDATHARLEQLVPKMKKAGYVPRLESSWPGIADDEKEAELCGHSEKLAIAYALNKTAEGTSIRIVKNLRVCEDCHSATAYISKVEKRTIICRDASRFHVYKEGKCSCGDYW